MTKEKMEENIICLLGYCNDNVINSINDIFEEFTRTNVCIPKGENRHPYADVLHEWVEDITKELQYDSYLNGTPNTWEKSSFMHMDNTVKLRIKPANPVYEWQWLVYYNKQPSLVGDGRFHTEEELKTFPEYIKIKETKRVRG